MEPEIPEPQFNCTIEVKIEYCETWNCQNPVVYPYHRVEIYESQNEAISGESPIIVDSTNQNGWVKFYDFPCHNTYVVKVDLEEHGVYINELSFFIPNQIADINVIKNNYFDFNAWAQPIVQQVSLEFPVVGQYSSYRYFQEQGAFTFENNYSYSTSTFLQVYYSNQLDENTFAVVENLNNSDNTYLGSGSNGQNYIYTETIWRIESDTLFISSQYSDNGVISMIWNITEDEELVNGEYAIPLKNESNNYLQIQGEFDLPVSDWNGVGACSDFQNGNYLFEDLLVDKRNYTSDDGPLKYLIFNKREGLVRSLYFSEDSGKLTAGFDLDI